MDLTPSAINIKIFKQRLAEAIAWCTPHVSRADLKNSLRTPELKPHDQIHWVLHDERQEITSNLFQERARLLRIKNIPVNYREITLAGGRLLIFDPVASLSDSGPEVASEGFFDYGNIPAWDTWVYYGQDSSISDEEFFSSFLISWVPHSLIKIVNKGIEVNPEGSIKWAIDVDIGSTRALKACGLLD